MHEGRSFFVKETGIRSWEKGKYYLQRIAAYFIIWLVVRPQK